jgi:chromate transporter
MMHQVVVEEKRWIDERRFLHALNFCMFLPGPEAQQLATCLGWLMHGVRGGLIAGLLFILPGFLSILLLSYLYVVLRGTDFFDGALFGLKCAVLAIIAQSVVRLSRRVLKHHWLTATAIIAFLLLWAHVLSFPAVICLAAMAGLLGEKLAPGLFSGGAVATPVAITSEMTQSPGWRRSLTRALKVSAVCLTLWFGPLLVLFRTTGADSVWVQLSVFFSKAAVVTFGGAYSVLSYVEQQAVDHFQWVTRQEMLDGLGMAETTPGPLIMVVQFVGFLAAARNSTQLSPWIAGTLGAILTTWVTFVPCFFWVFLCAPWLDDLLRVRWLKIALTSVSAAVIGVISTLGISLATSTLFQNRQSFSWGLIELQWPEWGTVNPDAIAITGLAMGLTFAFRQGLAVTLALCVGVGLILRCFQ